MAGAIGDKGGRNRGMGGLDRRPRGASVLGIGAAILAAAVLAQCGAESGANVAPVASEGRSGRVPSPMPGAEVARSKPPQRAAPATEAPGAPIPGGAIKVGEDLYQVPVGKDADGCPVFRLWSSSKAVVQAIFYKDRKGGFTMDKSKAECG
jgi:hypothetical protein